MHLSAMMVIVVCSLCVAVLFEGVHLHWCRTCRSLSAYVFAYWAIPNPTETAGE